MKILKYSIILGSLVLTAGCKKFLEKEPKKQTSIQTADQLEALINNATLYTYDGNNATACYSTDDTEITPDALKKNPGKWTYENLYHYTFQVDPIVSFAADPLWNGEYKKIFTANLVLFNLDKVTGPDTLKAQLAADAHFMRAWSYWLLANHYCLPYSKANENEPGLPLKLSVDYDEPLKRASLKETYDLIMADLAEAQNTTWTDVNPLLTWRVSKKAVDALLSRIYLFNGEYDKSLEASNRALASTTAKLKDYKTIVAGVAASYSNPTAKINYSEFNDWATNKFLTWPEFYYARFSYTSSQWWIPSTSLVNLFDKNNDLRYKWLMMENGNRRFTITDPMIIRYSFFSDGRYIPTGPTVAEMLLNKAEVQARKGDFAAAMTTLNILRDKRFNTAAPLTATDRADAIKKVLDERRREMPFAMRWFDIRRFAVNDYPADDVTVVHPLYKIGVGTTDPNVIENYTLPVGSKRYAVPINGVEMDAAKGQIIQNQY